MSALGIPLLTLVLIPELLRGRSICIFHNLTGLHCPGCGGLRAARALIRGDYLLALQDNALAVGGGPLLCWAVLWAVWRFATGRDPHTTPVSARVVWLTVILITVFAVLRNLPFWSFDLLAPSPLGDRP